MTGDDELLLDLSKQEGWKQCPSCSILIELRSGCNHITCQNCTEEFCYRCLKPWSKDNGMCSSGECEVWDEDRLVEAGEARVQQLEAARGGRIFPERIRQERMARAVAALRANETCQHEWGRRDGITVNVKAALLNYMLMLWSVEQIADQPCVTPVLTIVCLDMGGTESMNFQGINRKYLL
eukprot:CAMPEP_0194173398 /NCGR_PEP_ID=MMETSP0154-20130528/7742_1 /TAXON_ID=1049557 /ORGANISM="Thalassiothrix antarctica, Strain L6-D1" /LENGTH=180 /DNA_ID=CAMNT_0038886451 /DNA_START=16 /DNA_END=556 /DNA_ORIENTATION=+